MGARARETVEQHAGLHRVIDSLVSLYRACPVTAAPVISLPDRST